MRRMTMEIAAAFLIAGCSSGIDTYTGNAGVYFAMPSGTSYANSDTTYTDSSILPFVVTEDTEAVFHLKIKILGKVEKWDRKVSVRVVEEESTTLSGDYDALDPYYILKAGEVFGTVPVRFHRTASLEGEERTLTVELVPNEDFSLPISLWRNSSTEYVNVIRHSIRVSDKYVQLPGYAPGHFGPFSQKKMKILLELFSMNLMDFNEKLPVTVTKALGQKFDRWLKEMKAKGETVLEEDGSEMKAGDYIYL